MPTVALVEFTDPACPFAYSAEPVRWRLAWRFGEHLDWTTRVVGLARDADAQRAKGHDPQQNAAMLRDFDRYGMPLTTATRREPAGTWRACRWIVAAREADPAGAVRLLRALRVLGLAEARAIDDVAVLRDAARRAGLTPEDIEARAEEPATERTFRADLEAARDPGPAARALDHKLADVEPDWDGAQGPSGRRYTCPTFVLHADGRTAEIPGFQPWEAVEAVVANLVPDLERRPWPDDVAAILAWAPVPLATQEHAALLGTDRDDARRRLRAAGAVEHAAGTDAFWAPA